MSRLDRSFVPRRQPLRDHHEFAAALSLFEVTSCRASASLVET